MVPRVEAVKNEYQARADEEDAILARILAENSRRELDELLLPIGPATAALMRTIVEESEARPILEVGTSYGYSTVWLAEAARATGGIVTSLELQQRKIDYARAAYDRLGLLHIQAHRSQRTTAFVGNGTVIELHEQIHIAGGVSFNGNTKRNTFIDHSSIRASALPL